MPAILAGMAIVVGRLISRVPKMGDEDFRKSRSTAGPIGASIGPA
jgi:hypothetical protein